ncbi:MAG: E3 ubiquitin-protein ligase APD1-4 domain-containing protein [Candidatus Kariarchaeaceae archaeon]
MRRGGGSRGGGFRGGGSRSSFRSSRRHHRRYGYGPRYYGRGYYGGGYYGYRRGPGIGVFIVIGVIAIIAIFIIAATFGSSNSTAVDLGPERTRLFHPSTSTKGSIQVDDPSGVVETYFFDERPGIDSSTVNRLENISSMTMFSNNFQTWSFYLLEGSTVQTSWSAEGLIGFYVVKGNSDYDKWKDGESTEKHYQYQIIGNYLYHIDNADTYHFIFYNDNPTGITINAAEFSIQATVHDLSNFVRKVTGTFSEDLGNENYIVLHNPSDQDLYVTYTEDPKYSFWLIIGAIVVVFVLLYLLISKWRKSKATTTTPIQHASPAPTQQPSYQQQAPVQSQKPQYYKRPDATFCNACGSGLLPSSEFCSECGTKV